MEDLLNQVVIIRDTTGACTEGVYKGVEEAPGGVMSWFVLHDSQQINFVDAVQGNKYEAWSIEGANRIATHLVVGIHKSHLPQKTKAKANGR